MRDNRIIQVKPAGEAYPEECMCPCHSFDEVYLCNLCNCGEKIK